jgi:hypothetical protein
MLKSGNWRPAAVLAAALSILALPSAGYAYTPEQQQACSDDAFRLCSADIPDVDRITVCMIKNKSQLSPRCRVYFEPTPASVGDPMSIKPQRSNSQKSRKSQNAS